MHLATGALVNAYWDLWAKIEKKPLWKLLVDMVSYGLLLWIHIDDGSFTPQQKFSRLPLLMPYFVALTI